MRHKKTNSSSCILLTFTVVVSHDEVNMTLAAISYYGS